MPAGTQDHAPCGVQVVFVDRNKDMWMRRALQGGRPLKLAAMVDCAVWHASVDMLATLTDHRLVSLCTQHCSLTCKTIHGLRVGTGACTQQRLATEQKGGGGGGQAHACYSSPTTAFQQHARNFVAACGRDPVFSAT